MGEVRKLLRKDLKGGVRLADRYGFTKPLDRLDTSYTPESKNSLNLLWAKADPRSQGYAGSRSTDTKDYLSRFKNSLDGYTSTEYNAFREQATGGINADYATRLNQLKRAGNRGRVRGAAGVAQMLDLNKSRIAAQRGVESDLFVRSADEKQRRLESYGQALRGIEGDEFTRARDASKDYTDLLGSLEDRKLKGDVVNLEQQKAEEAKRVAAILGFANTLDSRRFARKQLELAEKEANKPIPAAPDYSGLISGLISGMSSGYNTGVPPNYDPSQEIFV